MDFPEITRNLICFAQAFVWSILLHVELRSARTVQNIHLRG